MIAEQAHAANHGLAMRTQIGMVAKRLPSKNIADVYLHFGYAHGSQRIAQRNGGVRVSGGIYNQPCVALRLALLHGCNQLALVVGLLVGNFYVCKMGFQLLEVALKTFVAINFGLAHAQHI